MKNVEVTVKGTIATITVDLSKEYGPSSSGKTIMVASTEGNMDVIPGVMLGLNVYKKPKA